MIETSKLIPNIYNTSVDFKVFEALYDVVFNSADMRINALSGLHSPEQCFDENLGKLANLFALPTTDRNLIKQYRLLRKNKGIKDSLEFAINACGAEIKGSEIDDIINSGKYTNTHVTYYVKFKNFNGYLFSMLRKRFSEFNCQLQLLPESEMPNS